MAKRIKTTGSHTIDKPASAAGPIPKEEIAACAHGIWLREGCPEGRAVEHWLQAEAQLTLSRGDYLAQPEPDATIRRTA